MFAEVLATELFFLAQDDGEPAMFEKAAGITGPASNDNELRSGVCGADNPGIKKYDSTLC